MIWPTAHSLFYVGICVKYICTHTTLLLSRKGCNVLHFDFNREGERKLSGFILFHDYLLLGGDPYRKQNMRRNNNGELM